MNGKARVEYDQRKAFEGADFIYAKNWSAYTDPNYGKVINTDRAWTVDAEKMALTNNAYFMHCLPVRRNMIVTDEVIESSQSIVRSLFESCTDRREFSFDNIFIEKFR